MHFTCKVHRSGDEVLVAIADSDIVGKEFSEKGNSLTISTDFYGEDRMGASDVLSAVKSATIVNALGQKTVELLVKSGIVKEKDVVRVFGLPHAQIICV